MPVECPNCRGPISRFRLFRSTAFGRWRCKHCDALIAVDTRRRLIGIVAGVVLAFCLAVALQLGVLRSLSVVTMPIVIGVTVLTVLAIDRPMLIERAGFRCHACGYDLRGQVVPRCPECGTQLDEQQQAFFAVGDHPAHMPVPGAQRRRRFYIAAILLFVAIMMAIGTVLGNRAKRQLALMRQLAAAMNAAATQPATQPTTRPTTMPATQSTTQPTMKPTTLPATTNPTTAQRAASAPAGEPMP